MTQIANEKGENVKGREMSDYFSAVFSKGNNVKDLDPTGDFMVNVMNTNSAMQKEANDSIKRAFIVSTNGNFYESSVWSTVESLTRIIEMKKNLYLLFSIILISLFSSCNFITSIFAPEKEDKEIGEFEDINIFDSSLLPNDNSFITDYSIVADDGGKRHCYVENEYLYITSGSYIVRLKLKEK